MTVGDKLRKENKHRKIIVRRAASSNSFTVFKVVNTVKTMPRQHLTLIEIEDFISLGFTVEITS